MTNYLEYGDLRSRLRQDTGLEFNSTWENLVGSLGADWEGSYGGKGVADLVADAYVTPLENVSKTDVFAFGGGEDKKVLDWLWNVIYSEDWEGYFLCAGRDGIERWSDSLDKDAAEWAVRYASAAEWDANYEMYYRFDTLKEVYEWSADGVGEWMSQEAADQVMRDWSEQEQEQEQEEGDAEGEPSASAWDDQLEMLYRLGPKGTYQYAYSTDQQTPLGDWMSYEDYLLEVVWDEQLELLYRMLPGGTYQYARSDDRRTRRAGTAWMFYDEAHSETTPGMSAAQEDAAGQIEAAVLELIARLSDDKRFAKTLAEADDNDKRTLASWAKEALLAGG
jgi:hypothetical protein